MKFFYSAYLVKKTKTGKPRVSSPEIYADNLDDQKDIEILAGAIEEYTKRKFIGAKTGLKCEFYIEATGDILKTTKEMKRFDMIMQKLTDEDSEYADYWRKFNKRADSKFSKE
jgi:hypothetical protein